MAPCCLTTLLASHTVRHAMITTLLGFPARFAGHELPVATRLHLRRSGVCVFHLAKVPTILREGPEVQKSSLTKMQRSDPSGQGPKLIVGAT